MNLSGPMAILIALQLSGHQTAYASPIPQRSIVRRLTYRNWYESVFFLQSSNQYPWSAGRGCGSEACAAEFVAPPFSSLTEPQNRGMAQPATGQYRSASALLINGQAGIRRARDPGRAGAAGYAGDGQRLGAHPSGLEGG